MASLGPFGQAHELNPPGPVYKPWVFTLYNEAVGLSWTDLVITTFFGFQPPFLYTGDDQEMLLFGKDIPRGFVGKLVHVPWAGHRYTITSGCEGIGWEREE